MKKSTKIISMVITLFLVLFLWTTRSQYAFIAAAVDNPSKSSTSPVSRNSITIIRKIDLNQNSTGKRMCFWWYAEYLIVNVTVTRRVMEIKIVTNPSPTDYWHRMKQMIL